MKWKKKQDLGLECSGNPSNMGSMRGAVSHNAYDVSLLINISDKCTGVQFAENTKLSFNPATEQAEKG